MEEKCLAGSVVHIHDMELHALMDTGATTNFLSPQVITRLSLKPGNTSKVVTVATGDKPGAIRKLTGIPVLFDDLQANVEFIVLQNVLFGLFIGHPTIERVGGGLDFPR